MILRRLLLLTLVALSAANLGCDHKVTQYPVQPAVTQDYRTDEVYLTRVRLTDVDQLRSHCPNLVGLYYGCAKARFETLAAGRILSVCTIYVLTPDDFNDMPKLAIQGHEIDHCFGRTH